MSCVSERGQSAADEHREEAVMEVGIVRKNSVQDAVYQVLRDAIMSLRLEPGTVMSTQEMANKLNVSRTPVREAFIRLQKESLVDTIPQMNHQTDGCTDDQGKDDRRHILHQHNR